MMCCNDIDQAGDPADSTMCRVVMIRLESGRIVSRMSRQQRCSKEGGKTRTEDLSGKATLHIDQAA